MTANRLTALPLLLVALMTGCQPITKTDTTPTTQPVISPAEKIATYRQAIAKLKPGSIVGLVVASQPEGNFAAVGDVPVQNFKVGQTIAFVDLDGNTISNGQIKNIVNDLLILKYDPQGKRPPQKGDLALWLKE